MTDPSRPRLTVDPKFVITRQGKRVVLYAGLLDTAHPLVQSIATELLHLDVPAEVAVCRAVVTLADGRTFTGIGDCTPKNAGGIAANAWVRMAETRAKSRALRDAINVGDLGLEGDAEDDPFDQAPAYRPPAQAAAPRTAPVPIRPASPEDEATLTELMARWGPLAFDAQAHGIRVPEPPQNAVGLTRALESLEGQVRRARAAAATPAAHR